ncbi:MAG: GTP-dependent dephospho-CoA kinase family protein [Nitrososphaera sp.]|nr:GTP-dependent dephospho-CoA kinase family protein [Nitrososphaera sp.]
MSPLDIHKLKQPFGRLVADKDVSKQLVLNLIRDSKLVAAVGDATTQRLVSYGIIPDIAVIDGKERRSKIIHTESYHATLLRCSNPSGGISEGAMHALKDAVNTKPPVLVTVDGEEDLLALPLFAMVPLGSIILYGQPLEGLVVVKITAAKKKEAKDLMDKISDNTNLITTRGYEKGRRDKAKAGPSGSKRLGKKC